MKRLTYPETHWQSTCQVTQDPERSTSLDNLAVFLSTRYHQLGVMSDLDEVIYLSRDALALHPLGHPGRSTSLNNLASHLWIRYDQLGVMNDLDEAIDLS